jgi:ArsR family transcriptional regulator
MKSTMADPQALDEATRLIKAFADPVRLRLLNLLRGAREVCVCHLHEALELPQPTVSRHLALLRKERLVVGRKEGLWVYYRLSSPRTKLHRALLASVETGLGDLDVFRRDLRRLERDQPCCES